MSDKLKTSRKKILLKGLFLFIIFIIAGCSKGIDTTVDIRGSDTMVNVTMAWAQKLMELDPLVDIVVNGGGSSVGIQSLITGTADVANASREIKPDEIKEAKSNKVNPFETIVGFDGIVVAVNKYNPVSKLTIKQLSDIFTGKIKNWKEVGGRNRPIVLLSRESSSGTYEFFKEHVINEGKKNGGKNFAASASLLNNSSQIVEQIESNQNDIGYFGLGYATDKLKMIAVAKETKGPYIKPTVDTVKNKSYTISRPLIIYTNDRPKGNVKKYIDFVLGPKGQRLLEKAGFIAVR